MFYNPMDSRSIYNLVDFSMRALEPFSDYCLTMAKQYNRVSDTLSLPVHIPFLPEKEKDVFAGVLHKSDHFYRTLAGYFYLCHLLTNKHKKPRFDIDEIKLGNDCCDITEEIIDRKSFCKLIHFKKMHKNNSHFPKMLVVAPMSGHHATLLRDTVVALLPFYDVYITDWKNARDVPLFKGSFDLDEYTQYVISFIQLLGPELHVMAVCQPTVPVLTAIALMSSDKDPKLPHSAILIGGPIDTSQSPTSVNELATSRGDDWFKQNVISIVPNRFKGGMRLVYPGFMQLAGFISMNPERHIESLTKAINDFADNKVEDAFKTIRFYTEYLSTMDLTAEFYMQTIDAVFQKKILTKGRCKSHGRTVHLKDVRKTAILAIEGGRDDITGVGQTKSVLTLCENLPESMKKYLLVEEVGHFGLFSGSKFRQLILPQIQAFTQAFEGREDKKRTVKVGSKIENRNPDATSDNRKS